MNTILKSPAVKYYLFRTAKKVYCTISMYYRRQIKVLASHRPLFATLIASVLHIFLQTWRMVNGHGGWLLILRGSINKVTNSMGGIWRWGIGIIYNNTGFKIHTYTNNWTWKIFEFFVRCFFQ